MKTLYETYVMLTESFQSKYVRMFAQDASLFNKSFNQFTKAVGIYYVAWDKITDDDIIEMTVNENTIVDVLKMFRALKAGKENYWSTIANQRLEFKSKWCILLGYIDNRLYCTYNSRNEMFYLKYSSDFYKVQRPKEMENELSKCDTLYMLLVDKHDVKDLGYQRGAEKYGMVPSLDAKDRTAKRHTGVLGKDVGGVNRYEGGEFTNYCKRQAQEAINRWKQIIAENKFKRTSDTKEIDRIVEDTVQLYFRFMQDVMKAAATNKDISQYRLADITDLVTGKAKSSKYNDYGWLEGGLLNVYRQYCQANVCLAKGTNYAESDIKSRDNAEAYIKELVPVIKQKIEKLRAEWKM